MPRTALEKHSVNDSYEEENDNDYDWLPERPKMMMRRRRGGRRRRRRKKRKGREGEEKGGGEKGRGGRVQ